MSVPYQPNGRLIHEHLLKGKPPPCQLQILHGIRKMRLTNGEVCLAEMMLKPNLPRQGFRAAIIHFFQCPLHHFPV